MASPDGLGGLGSANALGNGGVERLAAVGELLLRDPDAAGELTHHLERRDRSPRSMREMYAALQPGNASSRWLRPAASRASWSRLPTATGSS